MTSPTATMPQSPQQEPPPVATASGKKGKYRKGASKDKAAPTNPAPPQPPKHTIQCDLCDVVGHTTHTCPKLPHLKPMVNVAFPESTVLEAFVSSATAAKNPKTIHTNHPCALCDLRGHYTHLCPRLEDFRTSLAVVCQFEAKRNESTSPIFAHFSLAKLPYMTAPIDIPPPDVEMMEPSSNIFFLSSSMRPSGNIPSESSPVVSLDLPSAITLGSTSVDHLSTYSSVTPCDDAHVNLSSHDDDSGHFTTSGGLSSTSHPIFYHDDDIMEEIPTPDFIYSPLHRTHALTPHPPCGHYIKTQCLGKGAHTFERPQDAILHHSPSVSGRVDSRPSILPHLDEPLESHITSDHSRDDTPYRSLILHQQPSRLDIIVDQPIAFLREHQFIISKSSFWDSDTRYANSET